VTAAAESGSSLRLDPVAPVTLGRTGLSVSRLGFGGAPLATYFWGNDEGSATSAVERALGAGITHFDTAPLYGLGESERRLGGVLSRVDRDRFVVGTKVGRLLRPSHDQPDERDAHFDYSGEGVKRSIEESLERLGLERVDIVHIHDPDDHMDEAIGTAFPALAELRSQGLISAISAGQTHPLTALVRETDLDCLLLAGRYTLLDQTALDELFPLCQERKVAVIAAGVFNSGVIADPAPGSWFDYAPAPPEILERAERLASLCTRFDVPLKAAALRFPLGHPAVACEIVGMRNAEEVDENLRLASVAIPDDLWREMRAEGLIDERAPSPGSSARRST
jgi:aryl-alcohol dehydrogenase-like predicted oxidoreductase